MNLISRAMISVHCGSVIFGCTQKCSAQFVLSLCPCVLKQIVWTEHCTRSPSQVWSVVFHADHFDSS